MQRHHAVTIILSVVTFGLCAVWISWSETTVAQSSDAPQPMAAKTSEPAASVHRVSPAWSPRTVSASAANLEDEPDPSVDAEDEREVPLSGEAAIDAHEQSLARRLELEGRDPEWSAETEQAIRSVLREEAFAGSSLLEASCASTLCRAEIQLDDELAHDRFLEHAPMTAPFATNGMIRTLDQALNPRVVVYFARHGHTI